MNRGFLKQFMYRFIYMHCLRMRSAQCWRHQQLGIFLFLIFYLGITIERVNPSTPLETYWCPLAAACLGNTKSTNKTPHTHTSPHISTVEKSSWAEWWCINHTDAWHCDLWPSLLIASALLCSHSPSLSCLFPLSHSSSLLMPVPMRGD